MDPKQTLLDAEQAFSDCRFGDSVELLAHYYNWRLTGGFEPRGLPSNRTPLGDAWAGALMLRVSTALQQVAIP